MDRELVKKARWRQSSKRGMRGKTQSGKLTEKKKEKDKERVKKRRKVERG